MKKTIFLFCITLGVLQNIDAQILNANDNYGSSRINCNSPGSQSCMASVSISGAKSNTQEQSPVQIIRNDENKLVFRYFKSSMNSEQEKNFKSKFAYIVEEDIILDATINTALGNNSEKAVILKQGMYPIIEWEDSYFISLQIETK